MINRTFAFLTFALLSLVSLQSFGQKGIFVDQKGVIRWEGSNREAAFFGVNYTVPFAYGYRSHKVLKANLEKAIQQDVYHMARLGIDAFRVHVWDTEITDKKGNLLENDHLRLFDFLVAELKKRNIKILVTPIAFWGNGYPEKDEKTQGFSSTFNKQQALVTEEAIKAQENYVKQFFKHVNPYTKLTYTTDPDVLATEINNEPHHSGPKDGAKNYVNRLAAAIRSVGWKKPVFYNISESPWYSDAVANSNIDGVSFQWYPTGLVRNRTLKGNYLPNVDQYTIPFDSVPAYKNKARMVYEFDAGDVLQSTMYPAMARSFRQAGFQWATQFAYDPMATAYANTEYQTHYLNLAYTPGKAISLMIASKVFHQVPRLKSYGTYPANSKFDVFRVSYEHPLSEMNTEEEFYYSNSTESKPVSITQLKKIAGVGSSAVVDYKGTGAYFLDKLENGVWRLEVMPDAIHIRDPFEKASLRKEVTRIQWEHQPMRVMLPDLGSDFNIKALNSGNTINRTASSGSFSIYPGTYLITMKGSTKKYSSNAKLTSIYLNEFAAPAPVSKDVYLTHEPIEEVSANRTFRIDAKVVGVDTAAKVTVELSRLGGPYKALEMKRSGVYNYSAEVPAEFTAPGAINYRIIVQEGDRFSVYPGNYKDDPHAWDTYTNETWQVFVAPNLSPLALFNANSDKNYLSFPSWDKNITTNLSASTQAKQLVWKMEGTQFPKEKAVGLQYFIGDKLQGRASELTSFQKVIIRARSKAPAKARTKIALVDATATSYATFVDLDREFTDIEIPLSKLTRDASMLLPRPYPGFMPFWFKPMGTSPFSLTKIEKLEVALVASDDTPAENAPFTLEIESITLQK